MPAVPCRRAVRPLAACVFVGLVVAAVAGAAPYDGARFDLSQPDGTRVPVKVWGDEYFQHIESLDGYTLVRDSATRVICYAALVGGGDTLVSTGVPAGDPAVATLGLARHLALPAQVRRDRARDARALLDSDLIARQDKDMRDPQPSCLGEVHGITLIVDFSDQVGTVPPASFDDYLNLPGYNGFGNHGSVRDFFLDVSDGALEYTNFVSDAYYRAVNPKTYYDDPNVPYGQRARELVREALQDLESQGFDFSQYDANRDGYIDALNIFYAGVPNHGWSVGLWPHSGGITWSADGVTTYRYQITNIGSSLSLATFCHENGHMLCFWPDLYDYDGDSAGVGAFCLMCSTGAGTNPTEPCAPLRDLAGWTDTVVLEGLMDGLTATAGVNLVYKVPFAGHANEYYMVENRQRTGRDANIPDAGLAIWHVDLNGSNNDQQQTLSQHYFCTLMQADGRWDLENNRNNGDSLDLWSAPGDVEFNPDTNPAATWWDGRNAPIYVDAISASGPTMTFNYREGLGTMAVVITAEPGDVPAPWHLAGPGGFDISGTGDRNLLVVDEGEYTLTWLDLPGWREPANAVVSGNIVNGGAPLTFTGTYTDPPFTAVSSGPLADSGPGRGVSMVDIDGDADLDIYVCNANAANRLLRNDGGLAFTDIADGVLADTGPTMAAAFADIDDDGDEDVYLSRDGVANLLLERDAGGQYSDIAQYGIDDPGPGRAASWCDYDRDGHLDLYVVNQGSANQLFRSFGNLGGDHVVLYPAGISQLAQAGPGTAAPWCDFDGNGFRDLYIVNLGTANVLVQNWNGSTFQVLGDANSTLNGRAAAWGDVDNDGDLDLLVINDGQPDILYRREVGYFQQVSSPSLNEASHGRGVVLADFDNDGYLDLYVACNGEEDRLVFGTSSGDLATSDLQLPETEAGCMAVACGDVDGDGGLDLYVSRDGQPNVLLHNTIVDRGHWLQIDLRGDGMNRDAIGARVRVIAGGLTLVRDVAAGGESLAQHARRLAFGLGSATMADSVVVRWPDGSVKALTRVLADRVVTVNEGTSTDVVADATPAVTALAAPYPNPFNPRTSIAFTLARGGAVDLAVYGLDGRCLATLVAGSLAAGQHEATWSGCDGSGHPVASGTYLCRLRTAEGTWSHRLTLVK